MLAAARVGGKASHALAQRSRNMLAVMTGLLRSCALLLWLPAMVPAQTAAAAPTFARDIAPIVYGSCTPCHRPGTSAPFVLLGYDDVWKKRKQIVEVTQQKRMPPWLPVQGDFEDDRRLAPEQIELLRLWDEAGAPRGEPADEPPLPQFPAGWQLREPDLVVRAEQLVVPADGPDRFRNLVIPIDAGRLRFVEAVEIRPGNGTVHHAILGTDPTRESRRLDALDAEPGFPGMSLGGGGPPDGHFLGWTPGKRVRRSAPGMAWRLWPGHDLVLQLHLVPTGKPETVCCEIGLYFTDAPTAIEPVMLALFSEQIDIAPGVADFVLRDHVDVPVPVSVHAIYPHAHYTCRRMRGFATLPDRTERVLFAIDAWDFDWQDDYRFREPIVLPAGTRIGIEYVYDNSEANPNRPGPPRHVRFGQQSTDEMGTLTLTVTTGNRDDRLALERAATLRDLEKVGGACNVWLRLARVERERADLQAALAAARRAHDLEPGLGTPWLELGMCHELSAQLDEAVRDYEQALVRDPALGLAHVQLGGIEARAGRTEAAIAHFERALATHPNMPVLHHNLAAACLALDRLDVAEKHFRRALELEPRYFSAQFGLGRVLAKAGKRDEARAALQRAETLRPGDAAVAQALRDLDR
ncbi:MAG TPA: tetratricopeptide repeat protein [Planctomycetota bacterium]|nr:tetratricopeptide repeat protein [Planctomycetota bacterium]